MGLNIRSKLEYLLKNGRFAFIDFKIGDTFIEYDGIQHFKEIPFFKHGNLIKFDFEH